MEQQVNIEPIKLPQLPAPQQLSVKRVGNYAHWKGHSKYRSNKNPSGKVETPLTDEDFIEGMEHGKFLKKKHRAFAVLVYYSAVRKTEALRVLREQFQITRTAMMFDVGVRLKHGKQTRPLKIPFKAKYVDELREAIENTPIGQRVFPYSPKTGYNIIHRAFNYPHLFRLSRITNFFLDGWTIAQIKNWTGLTLAALEYYVGLVDTIRMGDSLAKMRKR